MAVVSRFLWGHRQSTNGIKDEDESDESRTRKERLIANDIIDNKESKNDRSINHRRTTTTGDFSPRTESQQFDFQGLEKRWRRMFTPKKEKGHWIPSLSSIIRAGDESIYSASLLDTLHESPGDLNLSTIHDTFAERLRNRPSVERAAYPAELSKFLVGSRPTKMRRASSVRKSSDSGSGSARPELRARASQRHSIDLMEMGLARRRSVRGSAMLVSGFGELEGRGGSRVKMGMSWTRDMQRAMVLNGKIGVGVTDGELEALAIVLGCPPVKGSMSLQNTAKSKTMRMIYDKGAFNISIHSTRLPDGRHQISLHQHKRRISQLPSRGSSYSTLFAKHLACGSIPISTDGNTVNSIFIDTSTLSLIQTGQNLHLERTPPSSLPPSSKFLSTLPSSLPPTFHTLTPSSSPSPSPPTPLIHAIATLPFVGGLPPLTTTPLLSTILFITCAGLPPSRLLQRLDSLLSKVHAHSPSLNLFGPLYSASNAGLLFRETERLAQIGRGMGAGDAEVEEGVVNAVSRMNRYVTMLERLMGLVPELSNTEVKERVLEAAKKEFENAYRGAVAIRAGGEGLERIVEEDSQPETTDTLMSSRSNGRSSTSNIQIQGTSLATQVEDILKLPLPFDIDTIAKVARLVVAGWALSVRSIDVQDFEVDGLGDGGLVVV